MVFKKVIFFIIFIYGALNATAECSFKTGSYSEELFNPKFIDKIEIEVPKSSKFSKNLFKILSSNSQNIDPKYKKRFGANIIVSYNFGECIYKGRVRQNGDHKDHIKFINSGKPIMSLDIKLDTGNILGAVRFKLLIPETRNSHHEVLGSILFRELGFIAPETFEVKTTINGIKSIMLFQENSRKELLERNSRRESAIFEGDETILWSFQKFKNFELEKMALARMINEKWIQKGTSSQKISLSAYKKLQFSYLKFHIENTDKNLFNSYGINPNKKDSLIFPKYFFVLLSINGSHALRPHNQKFYYNPFISEFEPIYYDGDLEFQRASYEDLETYAKKVNKKIDEDFFHFLNEKIKSEVIKELFLERVISLENPNIFYKNAIDSFLFNANYIYNQSNNRRPSEDKSYQGYNLIEDYESWQNEFNLDQRVFTSIKVVNKGFYIYSIDDEEYKIDTYELAKLLSENSLKSKRSIFVPTDIPNTSIENFLIPTDHFPGTIYGSSSIQVFEDSKNKLIEIEQEQSEDWVLINDAEINGWQFIFSGVASSVVNKSIPNQTFNEYGLTGCLNFYNSSFKNIKIQINSGTCEDSINIVNSIGHIDSINVINSYADAIDIDFSKVTINVVTVKNAGNDCFDVSGGVYNLILFEAINCGDKGISVGEKSIFNSSNIIINNSVTGVASKDLSKTYLEKVEINNVENCFESSQKKQEFGGAYLQAKFISCKSPSRVDQHSVINLL